MRVACSYSWAPDMDEYLYGTLIHEIHLLELPIEIIIVVVVFVFLCLS